MSEQATPAAAAAATQTPAQQPATATEAATTAKVELTSDQLKARLDETRGATRSALLKKFGVDSEAALEAKLKRLSDVEQAQMSEAEKAAARIKELEPLAERAKTLEQRLTREVDRKIASLPEDKRAKLVEKAGDDLNKRLEYLDLLEDMGALGSTSSSTPSSSTPPATPPPANTTGGSGAPRPTAAMTSYEEYEDIKKRMGEMAGEIFYRKHRLDIERTRPANA